MNKNTPQPKFKKSYIDFIVEEKLPYKLQVKGIWMYIQIEKRNINTMDLIQMIAKAVKISVKGIGFGGLKDKHALAKQRICLGMRDLKGQTEERIVERLSEFTKVLQIGYSDIPLNISSDISNHFAIRLRYEQTMGKESKQKISKQIESVAKKGFPNYFGEQRFGFSGKNHRLGQDILEGKGKGLPLSEKKFKLQAYASRLFNEYVGFRVKKEKIQLLEGDIIDHPDGLLLRNGKEFQTIADRKEKGFFVEAVGGEKKINLKIDMLTHITGPFIGYNTLLSPKDSTAGTIEQDRLEHFELEEGDLKLYEELKLFGLRRPLRIIPSKVKHSRQGDDVLISFLLPKSSYASTFIDTIFEE